LRDLLFTSALLWDSEAVEPDSRSQLGAHFPAFPSPRCAVFSLSWRRLPALRTHPFFDERRNCAGLPQSNSRRPENPADCFLGDRPDAVTALASLKVCRPEALGFSAGHCRSSRVYLGAQILSRRPLAQFSLIHFVTTMSTSPRILAFSGSARRESLNKKFLAFAVDAVREAGGEVTLIELSAYPLPLYNGDLEDSDGMPAQAMRLIELIGRHDGLLIASPEYNSMFTPLLKNTIDWCTRGDDNPFSGKVAGIVSASPGAFGGIRSQQLVQQLLLKLGCHVIPLHTTLPHADKAFDADGKLLDVRAQKSARTLAIALVELLKKLGA